MLQDFSFHFVKPRTSNSKLVNDCYRLWKKVWGQTFFELDGAKNIFSDDFSRQDEMISLNYKERSVALIMHRYCDFSKKHYFDDSYFKIWSAQALEKLLIQGERIVIGSQITIDPEFRKTNFLEAPVKELIVYKSLSHLKAQANSIDAITGVMRADKGMNNLFYKSSAMCLDAGLEYHNVAVDLMAFYPRRNEIIIPKNIELLLAQIKQNTGGSSEYQTAS